MQKDLNNIKVEEAIMKLQNEPDWEEIATRYDPEEDWDDLVLIPRTFYNIKKRVLADSRVLEAGCSTGFMSEMLADYFSKVDIVEISSKNIESVKNRLKSKSNCSYFNCAIEDYQTDEKYDAVTLSFLLEHVTDPVAVLRHVRNFLKENGQIVITVPNDESLNRRIGLKMGLLKNISELAQRGVDKGHRRGYTLETLRAHLKSSGLKEKEIIGVLLKPLSSAQMQHWSQAIINALLEVAEDMPEYASVLFCVAKRNDSAVEK